MSWMEDFNDAKRKETREKPINAECRSCGEISVVGDDGKCVLCFVKGADNG
jgi:hypothetical protein